MSPDEMLDKVEDRRSFITFVKALALEREAAESIERADPVRYSVDGEFGWKNADITSYLFAALTYFDARPLQPHEPTPSWKMFAEFLYCGKIIE